MKNLKNLFIVFLPFILQSCATVVKSPQTVVTFQGDSAVPTEVITPYGSTILRHGTGSLAIQNHRGDIPIQIVCYNEEPIQAVLPTNYSILPGIFGNLGLTLLWVVPGVVGFVIDGTGDKAYEPETPFNVSKYCRRSVKHHTDVAIID